MQELRLVAVSEDGTYLVLATAGRGTRFTLPVDDRLRAAVRGHFSRLGQFEIEVESPLRPKEIQARIRSGETAEEIAESAGIPVERVRWFEGPVLQEREYMAQQAQRVTVRRPGESTPGPPLGETVEERLGRGGVDLEEVEWDSWKCEDGTWRVRLSFFEGGRPHAAEWTFDPRRRHVSPLDEIAARLTSVEWDDDGLSDTVTPLVPRRPAMKVVGSDREVRGLPAEPEQHGPAGPPGPFRAAEAREYIIERGRMIDPRPAFREAPESAPLREASAPAGFRPGEASPRPPQAPSPAPSRDEREPDEAAEAAHARAAGSVSEVSETPGTAPEQDEATPLASEGETAEAQESAAAESGEEAHAEEPAQAQPADRPEEPATASAEDEQEAAQADEASESHDEDEQAEDTVAEARPEEPAEAEHAEPPAEAAVQAEDGADEARRDEPERQTGKAPEPVAAEEAVEAEPEPEPEQESRGAAASAEPQPARTEPTRTESTRTESTRTESARTEPARSEPAPVKKPPAPRQPPRAPAKKKPATRPTMPAAAQDKPATGSPAAASGEGPAAQRPARRRKAKGKRASVPSWDEIMFGARRPE
ncbi:septation protein SepH [Actinomadura chokoriensis]|uniref:septation protein SepH n=1 Tax=Actinomadura chokoriensis TaxID=454156 RepID=UPI0031F79852